MNTSEPKGCSTFSLDSLHGSYSRGYVTTRVQSSMRGRAKRAAHTETPLTGLGVRSVCHDFLINDPEITRPDARLYLGGIKERRRRGAPSGIYVISTEPEATRPRGVPDVVWVETLSVGKSRQRYHSGTYRSPPPTLLSIHTPYPYSNINGRGASRSLFMLASLHAITVSQGPKLYEKWLNLCLITPPPTDPTASSVL